jgi:hypothetical protein
MIALLHDSIIALPIPILFVILHLFFDIRLLLEASR